MFHILLCPVNDIIWIGKLTKQWNQIPEHEREEVVREALEQPEKSLKGPACQGELTLAD